MKLTLAALILLSATSASAQTLDVKVIDHQEHISSYNYVVPGYSTSNTTGSANCNGAATTTVWGNTASTNGQANCNGASTTNTISLPARAGSFDVRGATLSLLLPDGRIAVVNCDIKFAEHFAGAAGNHRNCREPLVADIQAEFHGDNARLIWVVSLDGKKTQSETYKILAVLASPKIVFWWFDEVAPAPGTPLLEIAVTTRAFEGTLAILNQAPPAKTLVRGGPSLVDSNNHLSTVSLDSWQKAKPNMASFLFYWQGEEVGPTTEVAHFQMTKRAYEQMLALAAGSDLRVRPSQAGDQNH